MPFILQGNELQIETGQFRDKNFGYDYPDGLDLHPSSETHTRLVSHILRYGLESARIISDRYSTWNTMDEKLTAYIATSDKEKEVKLKDKRKPVSIVFPYSYAILETLVSYLVSAFLQDPIFRYEGMGPEDVAGGTLLEKVIEQQLIRTKAAINLYTMFRDSCAYGFGAVTPQWVTKKGKRSINNNGERTTEDTILFEGNALANIDPYDYLPDPSVPLHDVQRGEFVGWMDRTTYMDLLSEEANGSDLFNVRYLQGMQTKSTAIFGAKRTGRTRNHDAAYRTRMNRGISDPVDLFNVHVKLIPSMWKLGPSDLPEKWLFTLAGDSVIVRAMPLGLNHDMFPVCVTVPDFDGYSPVSYSRLEVLGGMQEVIDWLFNSHIANVRKAINDVLIVDPYLININDLKEPEAGGLVRLRRPAWGKGVKDAVMQLNVVDITRQNITDVAAIIQYMQVIGGTDSPMMGAQRRGGPERVTRTEFRGTARGAVSRLERIAKIVGLQAMQDIGYMFAHHTQQFMEQDTWVRALGQWPKAVLNNFQVDQDRIRVKPTDLLVDYDLITRDGSVPGGNFSEVWPQLLQTIAGSEILSERLDVVRIFKYIAQSLGAKNVDDFEVQREPQQVNPQVRPDEDVLREVERGNLVGLGESL